MNPMLQTQLRRLEANVAALEKAAAEWESSNAKVLDEKEELRREIWTLQTDLSALRQHDLNYDAIAGQNAKLQEERKQLKAHAQRILTLTRALQNEYRP